MKINKLINVFNKLIPVYRQAVDEKLKNPLLYDGICNASIWILSIDVSEVFKTYYKNYISKTTHANQDGSYQRKDTLSCPYGVRTRNAMQFRLEFMKQEVKELKLLKKQGYTHLIKIN